MYIMEHCLVTTVYLIPPPPGPSMKYTCAWVFSWSVYFPYFWLLCNTRDNSLNPFHWLFCLKYILNLILFAYYGILFSHSRHSVSSDIMIIMNGSASDRSHSGSGIWILSPHCNIYCKQCESSSLLALTVLWFWMFLALSVSSHIITNVMLVIINTCVR